MKRMAVLLVMGLFLIGCGSEGNKEVKQSVGAPQQQNQALNDGIRSLQEGQPLAAIKSFGAAIREYPQDTRSYLLLGETFMRLKQYDRAADVFLAASRVAPQEGQIYYLLALNYGLSGNLDLAQLNAKKSIVLFQQAKDEQNFRKSVALLQGMMKARPDVASLTPTTK